MVKDHITSVGKMKSSRKTGPFDNFNMESRRKHRRRANRAPWTPLQREKLVDAILAHNLLPVEIRVAIIRQIQVVAPPPVPSDEQTGWVMSKRIALPADGKMVCNLCMQVHQLSIIAGDCVDTIQCNRCKRRVVICEECRDARLERPPSDVCAWCAPNDGVCRCDLCSGR